MHNRMTLSVFTSQVREGLFNQFDTEQTGWLDYDRLFKQQTVRQVDGNGFVHHKLHRGRRTEDVYLPDALVRNLIYWYFSRVKQVPLKQVQRHIVVPVIGPGGGLNTHDFRGDLQVGVAARVPVAIAQNINNYHWVAQTVLPPVREGEAFSHVFKDSNGNQTLSADARRPVQDACGGTGTVQPLLLSNAVQQIGGGYCGFIAFWNCLSAALLPEYARSVPSSGQEGTPGLQSLFFDCDIAPQKSVVENQATYNARMGLLEDDMIGEFAESLGFKQVGRNFVQADFNSVDYQAAIEELKTFFKVTKYYGEEGYESFYGRDCRALYNQVKVALRIADATQQAAALEQAWVLIPPTIVGVDAEACKGQYLKLASVFLIVEHIKQRREARQQPELTAVQHHVDRVLRILQDKTRYHIDAATFFNYIEGRVTALLQYPARLGDACTAFADQCRLNEDPNGTLGRHIALISHIAKHPLSDTDNIIGFDRATYIQTYQTLVTRIHRGETLQPTSDDPLIADCTFRAFVHGALLYSVKHADSHGELDEFRLESYIQGMHAFLNTKGMTITGEQFNTQVRNLVGVLRTNPAGFESEVDLLPPQAFWTDAPAADNPLRVVWQSKQELIARLHQLYGRASALPDSAEKREFLKDIVRLTRVVRFTSRIMNTVTEAKEAMVGRTDSDPVNVRIGATELVGDLERECQRLINPAVAPAHDLVPDTGVVAPNSTPATTAAPVVAPPALAADAAIYNRPLQQKLEVFYNTVWSGRYASMHAETQAIFPDDNYIIWKQQNMPPPASPNVVAQPAPQPATPAVQPVPVPQNIIDPFSLPTPAQRSALPQIWQDTRDLFTNPPPPRVEYPNQAAQQPVRRFGGLSDRVTQVERQITSGSLNEFNKFIASTTWYDRNNYRIKIGVSFFFFAALGDVGSIIIVEPFCSSTALSMGQCFTVYGTNTLGLLKGVLTGFPVPPSATMVCSTAIPTIIAIVFGITVTKLLCDKGKIEMSDTAKAIEYLEQVIKDPDQQSRNRPAVPPVRQ